MATTDARRRLALVALVAAALAGCATVDPRAGFDAVSAVARERLRMDVEWPRDDDAVASIDRRVAQLLAGPLSVDDAIQVALLNNRGLRASFHELGISAAEVAQAARLPNPGFGFARHVRGDEVEIERSLHLGLARLLAMPMTARLAQRRHERAQREVAQQVLALAAETRKAWYAAVAARQGVAYQRQVMAAAEAGAELARRITQAGNWNKLQLAREQGFSAEAALGFARAEQAEAAARERLTRLLGLWGENGAFRLPERLPELPARPRELPDVEQEAMRQRLDVTAARIGTEQLAANLGLVRATRFVNVLELGVVRNSASGEETQRGWEVSVELPLFDWGDARVARAEAIYRQALELAAQAAIEARSEVRQAYRGYRASYDVARHYRDEIVPIRKRISEENLLRYNGMLIGVFDLLADARAQIASVNGYIDALRDFWIAHADLEMARIGKPALSAAMPAKAVAPPDGGGAAH